MKADVLSIKRSEKDLQLVSELWGSGYHSGSKKHPNKILHRSDMLLHKQLTETTIVIEALDGAISEYENSHSNKEKEIVLKKIINLQRMSQHLKLILGILDTLNKEIKCYREKLHHSVQLHLDDDELLKQRVAWLERRLEKIVAENSIQNITQQFYNSSPDYFEQKTNAKHKPNRPIELLPRSILHAEGMIAKPTFYTKKAVKLAPLGSSGPGTNLITPDAADTYWNVGHHRFSYNENMGPLLEKNPLSYHNIGLAVPDTYVDKNIFSTGSGQSSVLPWLSQQDATIGNFDIMRDDLEKVRKRIHRIHDRIYAASNLSVRIGDSQTPVLPQSKESQRSSTTPQTQLMQSAVNYGRGDAQSVAAGSLARISSTVTPPSSTVSESTFSLLPEKSETKSVAPLTKLNMGKNYPYNSDRWTDAKPREGIALQPSICNQRDLQNKTKLRLFVPKRHSKKSVAVRDLVTPSSVSSSRSFRKVNSTVRFVEKLKSSTGFPLSNLQRSRLNDLLEVLVNSARADDRIYAARSLGSLGVTACDEISPILIAALAKEKHSSVRFEIAKALITLGEWHSSAILELNSHLDGNHQEVCLDILETIACSDDVGAIYLHIEEIPELQRLIESLHYLASMPDAEEISFQASICLGGICGIFDSTSCNIATSSLLEVIQSTSKWNWHAQALEVLVRRLDNCSTTTIKAIIKQLRNAIKWKDRLAAALLIAHAGSSFVFRIYSEDEIFSILKTKLWDDSKREVRLGVSQAFTALGLRNRLLDKLEERITSPNPEVRSQAVMSMSAVGIKSDKTLRSLVEMLGLDGSDYVRLQIMRTFHALAITDIRVVRALREREKGGGPLAREASKILSLMDVRLTTGVTTLPPSRQKHAVKTASDSRITTSFSWTSSQWGGYRSNMTTRDSRKRNTRMSSRRKTHSNETTPQYQIVSTAIQRPRVSAGRRSTASRGTYLTSASSFF